MVRVLVAITIMATGLGAARAEAPPPKANCSLFKRMSDGRWTSTIVSKVGNPKDFVTLQKGAPIARDLVVAGINVSDTIDKLCGK